ncbi:MmgE/PrpD family protein [Microbacteriaceae bacterium K1510]|nr:MmgE/PrpD family protein [Microbacteriaceae bacterium K1510]
MTKSANVEHRIVEAFDTLRTARLPDEAIEAGKQLIMDWLGCVLIGAKAAPAKALVAAHADEIGHGKATCFVGSTVCHPGLAALISGTASHTIELDDIYSPALYHPGVCVISAALAASQLASAPGDRFLRAVIAGYEISNRIGAGVNPDHYKYWHTTGTVGTFGAAIAAGIAFDLDARQMADAIGNAASMAAGLQQAFRSDGMTKPLHAGRAAEAGLLAARIARSGFTGSCDMISGPVGFVQAMSHGRDIAGKFDDLMSEWTVTRSMYKRFSSCGHIAAPIDVAMDLKRRAGIDPGKIERIDVATYAVALKAAGIIKPTSVFEAKFSLPFCVAASLLGYDLTDPASFERLYADRDIAALIDKVTLADDPQITAAFPKLRGGRVSITMKDGTVHADVAVTRKGEPTNPFTAGELRDKFRRLAGATRHRGNADAWLAWIDALPTGASVAHEALPSGVR